MMGLFKMSQQIVGTLRVHGCAAVRGRVWRVLFRQHVLPLGRSTNRNGLVCKWTKVNVVLAGLHQDFKCKFLTTNFVRVQVRGLKLLSCHAGCQEVSSCHIRGESETSIAHRRQSTHILDLKPRANIVRNQKQGYRWPSKRTDVLQFFKKKLLTVLVQYLRK